MGACCFCERSSRPTLRTIRVVHLDGFIEDYESPTTVNQVLNFFPKHFMTTPIRLMQIGLVPLKLDTQLEPGRVYFVLPCTFIRFNESSSDLIPLTKKLTNIAKTRQFKPKSARPLANPHDKGLSQISLTKNITNDTKTREFKSNPAPSASPQNKESSQMSLTKKLTNLAKPPRTSKAKQAPLASPQDKGSSEISDGSSNDDKNNMRKSTKGMSWKPLLATIREISFNRRESDLRD